MVKFKSFEFEEISHGGRLKLNESPIVNQLTGKTSKIKQKWHRKCKVWPWNVLVRTADWAQTNSWYDISFFSPIFANSLFILDLELYKFLLVCKSGFWLVSQTFPDWPKARLNRQSLNSDIRWQVGLWHDCNYVRVLTEGDQELKQLPSLLTWTSPSLHVRGHSNDFGREWTNSDSGLLHIGLLQRSNQIQVSIFRWLNIILSRWEFGNSFLSR